MLAKIRPNTNPKQAIRLRRKNRISKKLSRNIGTRPRLIVYRSNNYIYAQIIDDMKGATLCQANTQEKDFEKLSSKKNLEAAKSLGSLIGKRAIENKIEKVVFDRNGYYFHGRVKVVADSAREAGLQF